jgi:hypothetical protein
MKQFAAGVLVASAITVLSACGSDLSTSPTRATRTTVGFGVVPTGASAVTTYEESHTRIVATAGSWVGVATYGHPAPFIQFFAAGGTRVVGDVRITAGGPFRFVSVDLYSSTTPIPYRFVGLRNRVPLFTSEGTVPNTFGNFRTVTNPDAAIIDTLVIRLTNNAAPCCRNPMGLDNVVLMR